MKLLADKINEEMFYKPNNKVETYQNKHIVIFKPKITLKKEAVFSYYHFIIPLDPLPPIQIEKKRYDFEKNKVLCINPYQKVKVDVLLNPVAYYAIFIDKFIVENIVKIIYSKSDVHFNNDNFKINFNFVNMLNRFEYECVNKQKGYEFVLDCLSSEIVVFLLRNIKSDIIYDTNTSIFSKNKSINRVTNYIKSYYNNDFTLDELAAVANLSPYHFIRVFKSEIGKTPFEYLMNVRIEKAKELLQQKKYKIIEVGMECGFSNQSHFSTVFKKYVGVPPSQYCK